MIPAARELLRRTVADYVPHAPHPKQRSFVELDCEEALYGGAAGGGKSDALLMAALRFVRQPRYAALILRRTFTDLNLDGAIMDRARHWLLGSDARWSALDKRWTFPAGSTLTFGYLASRDDERRYQSAEFQYIGIDELCDFEETQYRFLFSRLRRTSNIDVPLRMRGATNPGGPGHAWVKKRWGIADNVRMDQLHFGPSNRVFVPATLDDNPTMDRAGYERSLSQLDSVTFSQLRHGSWRHDSAALVYRFDEHRNVVEQLPAARRPWIYVLGIDYGNVDATAMVVWAFNPDVTSTAFVVESEAWTGLDPYGAAEIVEQWSKRYPFSKIVGDIGGLGKGYAEEARIRFGLPIDAAQKQNKLGYIKLMNGAFERNQIAIVRSGNEALMREWMSLPWKTETHQQESPSAPNHLADAALYGWRETQGFQHVAQTPINSEDAAEREAELADEAQYREEKSWDRAF